MMPPAHQQRELVTRADHAPARRGNGLAAVHVGQNALTAAAGAGGMWLLGDRGAEAVDEISFVHPAFLPRQSRSAGAEVSHHLRDRRLDLRAQQRFEPDIVLDAGVIWTPAHVQS